MRLVYVVESPETGDRTSYTNFLGTIFRKHSQVFTIGTKILPMTMEIAQREGMTHFSCGVVDGVQGLSFQDRNMLAFLVEQRQREHAEQVLLHVFAKEAAACQREEHIVFWEAVLGMRESRNETARHVFRMYYSKDFKVLNECGTYLRLPQPLERQGALGMSVGRNGFPKGTKPTSIY